MAKPSCIQLQTCRILSMDILLIKCCQNYIHPNLACCGPSLKRHLCEEYGSKRLTIFTAHFTCPLVTTVPAGVSCPMLQSMVTWPWGPNSNTV
jgi:hypothetical protein